MSPTTATAPRNLFQKLAVISGELGAITKDSQAPQAMGGFKFMSHGALMGHLREKLAQHQVVILENLDLVSDEVVMMKTSEGERANRRIVVRLTAEFVNGESPDERYTASWYGEGLDTRDKALQKAGTSAEKYLLSKTFKVSDKDDPDAEAADEVAASSVRSAPPPTGARGSGTPPPSAPPMPALTLDQRGELAALNEALPEDLRLTDAQKRELAREGFEAMKEALLARQQEAGVRELAAARRAGATS